MDEETGGTSRCAHPVTPRHVQHACTRYHRLRYDPRLVIGAEPSSRLKPNHLDNSRRHDAAPVPATVPHLWLAHHLSSKAEKTGPYVQKAEVIHCGGPWRNFEAVEYATLEWVDWFNYRRLLEPIGTSRLPKPKSNTMLPQTSSIRQRVSHPTAFGKPGAVQSNRFDSADSASNRGVHLVSQALRVGTYRAIDRTHEIL